jgi:putative Holliday junction resolvase
VRALGLDVGSKTIGVAITDEANIAAHPLTVLERVGNSGDSARIAKLVSTHGVTDVVIGLPFELSGRIGHRARRVRELAAALRAALGDTVTYHEQDERFTTAEAERVLLAADVSRAKRRKVIDQQAAALILQAWLDGSRRSK